MKFVLLSLLLLPVFLFSQTQQQLDSMEALIPKRQGKEKVLLLNDLTYYYFQSDSRRAASFGEQSLKLAKQLNDKKLLANTYNDCSMPYLTAGNYNRVIYLNNQALTIRKELKDTSGLISSYAKLGNAYYELTRYKEAQHSYNEAIRYATILKQEDLLIQLYQNSANVLEASGYIEEALKIQIDVYKTAREKEYTDVEITCLGNLGSLYNKLKQYDKARASYLKAIPLVKETNKTELLSMIYQGLGVVERESGNTDLGLQYYKKALSIYRTVHSEYSEGIVAMNIGNCYADLKRLDSAEYYLLYGLDLLKKSNSYKQITNVYQNLAELEMRRKDYKKAAIYFEYETKYKDSVMLHSGNEVLSEMFAKYEVEKKERELAESQAMIAETRLKQVIWTVVSLALILVVLIIFFYFRHKRKLAKQELERKIAEEKLLREKQLNEQKEEISKELHDNIGSQITYMISSMDNLTYTLEDDDKLSGRIRNISEFGRETMQELRSTIWAMNSEDGSVELLFGKIEELRSRIPITLQLHNKTEKHIPLKAIEMLNLYRIAQEFIQNSLKYANATELEITARRTDQGVALEFCDNGSGFDTQNAASGNGLRNMKDRCEQLGGTFHLISAPEQGTTVSCVLRHLSY